MRTIILNLFFLISSFSVFATDIFETVDTKADFYEINIIENYLNLHPESTMLDLKKDKPELLEGIQMIENTNAISANSMKDMPLVGGFWWGCCLGVVGLALVYFISDNDRSQIRPALWGCLIFTVLGGGIYGFWNPFGW
jgi:hypothetical protein